MISLPARDSHRECLFQRDGDAFLGLANGHAGDLGDESGQESFFLHADPVALAAA